MSGKLQLEFEDSQLRSIESLSSSLELTSGQVSQLLAAVAVEFAQEIERLPAERLEELRLLWKSSQYASASDQAAVVAWFLRRIIDTGVRNPETAVEAGSIEIRTADHVDDELLRTVSENLMARKAELYRRLAQ